MTVKKLFFIVALLFVLPSLSSAAVDNSQIERCGEFSISYNDSNPGLINQIRPIAVGNENVVYINPSEGCAVVAWVSDRPATGRVVYSNASDSVSLDATKPNFGYKNSSKLNTGAYVVHATVLKNLKPGSTYKYRVASGFTVNSLPTVGSERSFFVPDIITLPVPQVTPVFVPIATTNTPKPQIASATVVNTPIKTKTVKTITYTTQTVPATPERENLNNNKENLANEKESSTSTNALSQATSTTEVDTIPSVLNAVGGSPISESPSFWQKIKSFFFGKKSSENQPASNNTDTDVTKEPEFATSSTVVSDTDVMEEMTENQESAQISDSDEKDLVATSTNNEISNVKEQIENQKSGFITLIQRLGFLAPTIFILLVILAIQKIALPIFGIIVERPLTFWMFSVILVAVAASLLGYYKITLVMIAIFLAFLAWFLLSEAIEEEENAHKEEKENPKIADNS